MEGILLMMPAQREPLVTGSSPDLPRQRQLVAVLRSAERYPYAVRGVGMKETHISWVLLAGRYAYKIKKALDLGFLDFSTLETRRFYCAEELRLNRRLAPRLYLDVVAIGGNPEAPVLGGEPAIEYAVRMRRFAQSRLMDRMLTLGHVTPEHMDQLAATIAQFHTDLPPAPPDSPYCAPDAVQAPVRQNFAQLLPLLSLPEDLTMLESVRQASMLEFYAYAPLFRQRAMDGCVRECHGDLHLGNIVLLDDTPTPFDGIEFSTSLRWIDVINEAAFPVMDLLQRGQPQLAWRFLNTYLEATGDYAGVGVLRFYLAYRAVVRAKVVAIRAHQPDVPQKGVKQAWATCRSHLALAYDCLLRRRPALIITHGLPCCGKTTFAQIVLERLGAIRIRSDVERKRLFNLAPLADSRSQAGVDIYSEEATNRTYAHLHELARNLIAAGFPVIVDAAFLRHAERKYFRALAKEMSVPFVIASLQADKTVLVKRLAERRSRGNDASEADYSVLQILQAAQEPLREEELARTVHFVNEGDVDTLRSSIEADSLLEAYLSYGQADGG
jgi:aminoglycoside phosphotransferase family enzyme/predicted kinase